MKRLSFLLYTAALALSLGGCEQVQQAFDTIDKAKSFKDDIEKTSNELKKKATDLIPGGKGKTSVDQEKNDERQDKARGEERDD